MNISEVNYKTNFGGRPAMISSSTGTMALLMVTLVKDHGLKYLLAAFISENSGCLRLQALNSDGSTLN